MSTDNRSVELLERVLIPVLLTNDEQETAAEGMCWSMTLGNIPLRPDPHVSLGRGPLVSHGLTR